jgi:hypothetical protein
MTAVSAPLAALSARHRRALIADCERIAQRPDLDFAVDLFSELPTNGGRDADVLREWAVRACAFGAGLHLDDAHVSPLHIIERADGLEQMLLARYSSRPVPTVELYTDTLALAEELTDLLGWSDWFPAGSLRAAACAHEMAHCHLQLREVKHQLKHALDATALRIGRRRIVAHIVGADELAAHSYAQTAGNLGRSPLLLTAAIACAADIVHRS